jgi:hypothetical protein
MRMKRSIFFILLCWIVLASCLKEADIDLAKPGTFTRYFSDGYNNVAVTVEQTKDRGFIILANSTYQNTDADDAVNNILVIKTNAYGDRLWSRYYPEDFNRTSAGGFVGHSLSFLPDSTGYLIVGQSISENTSAETIHSELLAFTISDSDGTTITGPKVFAATDPVNWNGHAGLAKADGNFLVLASDEERNSLLFTELVPSLDSIWSRTYSQGTTSLVPRLFFEQGSGQVIWGGHGIQASSTSDLFLTRSKLNEPSTETGLLPIGTTSFDEFSRDMCRFGNNFAYTGYSNQNSGSDGDIAYFVVSQNGTVLNSKVFDLDIFNEKQPTDGNTQFEYGNSIIAAADGGLIILGTIESYAGDVLGRGDTDLILMKISAFGDKQWSITHGSKDADEGNTIRQTRDGGYIILGTTRLGGLRTVTLIKTDANGEVN